MVINKRRQKWIMAAVVLEENVLPYVAGHVQERLGGAQQLFFSFHS